MSVRALDTNGDWLFGKGQNDLLRQKAEVAQDISTRLNSYLGDCFFDIQAGIDWFNEMGGKDLNGLDRSIRSVISNTDNVISILALSFVVDENRRLVATYTVNSVFGIINGSTSQDASIAQ